MLLFLVWGSVPRRLVFQVARLLGADSTHLGGVARGLRVFDTSSRGSAHYSRGNLWGKGGDEICVARERIHIRSACGPCVTMIDGTSRGAVVSSRAGNGRGSSLGRVHCCRRIGHAVVGYFGGAGCEGLRPTLRDIRYAQIDVGRLLS